MRNDIDWRKFIELAKRHRVECLVALNLAAQRSANVPDTVRDHFAKRLRRHSVYSLDVARATIALTEAFSDAGIPSILLKGHAVSARFYHPLTARQCIDIDILIPEEDLTRARSVVAGLGFEQYFPDFAVRPGCEDTLRALASDIAYRRASDGVQLELHWRLDRNPYLLNRDFDAMRALTTHIPLAGAKVPVLETPAQLTYLICHGAKHAWFRLKWLADIYRMLDVLTDEQSDRIARMSQRDGTMRMVATSLQLIRTVYDIPTDKFATEQMIPHEDPQLLDHMLRSIEAPAKHDGIRFKDLGNLLKSTRYLINLRSDIRYKRSVVMLLLADVRDIRNIQLSRKWLWLYILLGPCLAAVRVCKNEINRAGR